MKRYVRRHARGFQTIGIIVAAALVAGLTVFAIWGSHSATAVTDATITGKVLTLAGAPVSFTCMPPPGQQPPPGAPQQCGVGVEAFAGPGIPNAWTNPNMTDGSFTLQVTGGNKYQVNVRYPMEALPNLVFETVFVDIAAGETKNIGTIPVREKSGRISGIIKDSATGLPVANEQVNAFPMFKPEEGQQQGPMMPSMATSAADGTFTILVDVGRYGINLMQSPQSQYVTAGGPPLEANCETATCNITGIEILAVRADATIQGDVLTSAGVPIWLPGGVGARPVGINNFYEYNGPINQKVPGNNASGGSYMIKVPSSTPQYQLVVHVGQGGPNDTGPSYSVQGNITVTVTPNGTTTQNITVVQDTSSIYGKVISDSGFALSSCKAEGDKFGGNQFGQVFVNNDQAGKHAGANIKDDCSYRVVVGEGKYNFGYNLNPKAGYINKPAPPEEITVTANTDVEKNIVVTAGDAKVTGKVFGHDGAPMGNVWVEIGNEPEVRKDYKEGGQGKPEGDEDFKGPGGTKTPEDMMKFCSQKKNEKECKAFKLPPGAKGPGGCTNMLECTKYCMKNQKICQEFDKKNHDKPKTLGNTTVLGKGYARSTSTGRVTVNAEDVTKKDQGPDFMQNVIRMGTQAGPDGSFSLVAVSGHLYELRAFPGGDQRNAKALLPPQAVKVDLRTTKTASNIILNFREPFGTMTGKVTKPDGTAANMCHVGFWSENGEHGGTGCAPDGSYTIGYSQGKLHFFADSFDGKTPYKSDEKIAVVTNQKTMTQDFTLKERGFDVPSPASKSFDAGDQTTLMLDNGVEISIPSGAMGESGDTIQISVSPTVDLMATESAMPVGVGYSITATDSDGKTVSEFSSPVTINIPYDGDYVKKDLGLDENLLDTAYLDETTNSYQDIANQTQNIDENKFTLQVTHFSDYTIISDGSAAGLKSVAIESKGSKKAKITIDSSVTITLDDKKTNWNVGTAVFGDSGQYIVVSNKSEKAPAKYRGKVLLYGTDGKLKRTIKTPLGTNIGLNQLVEDITAKSGNSPDGTSDIIVAPATTAAAKAYVIDLKNKKNTTITTGTGTGATSLNTAELVQGGIANLTTLFGGNTAKAWKVSKGKLVQITGSVTNTLAIKNGKVEKKQVTPKVTKVTGKCKSTSSSKLTIKGTGFGVTSDPIMLWNATSALAVQSFKDTEIKITVNPSAVDVKTGANTLTIVNSDGLAGVGIVTCGI